MRASAAAQTSAPNQQHSLADAPRARRWTHRLTVIGLLLAGLLVFATAAPLLLSSRQAHAAQPFIARALHGSGVVPIGPWNDNDARSAIGASRAHSSLEPPNPAKPDRAREIAIVLKATDLRKRGATAASVIGPLAPGTVLLSMGESEGWLFVAHTRSGELQVGWVRSDDVRRLP